MMVDEQTPLLLRSSIARTNNRRRGRQHDRGRDAQPENESPDHLPLFEPVHDDDANGDDGDRREQRQEGDDKVDRRAWGGRMGNFVAHQLQKTASLLQNSAPFWAFIGMRTTRSFRPDDDDPSSPRGALEQPSPFFAPWNCTFGTDTKAGIWCNGQDQVGCLMASTVWVLFGYSIFTMLSLAQHEPHIMNVVTAAFFCTVSALALASHAKTALTDPGSVPKNAVPPNSNNNNNNALHPQSQRRPPVVVCCSTCQSYKPVVSHHCRICNRCVSRMDHHCPWMNNCVGAANLKHFVLFILYTWIACGTALLFVTLHAIACYIDSSNNSSSNAWCAWSGLQLHLVRVMTCLCLAALLFTTSMVANVTIGIVTGVGTIDRIQKKAAGQWESTVREPVALADIFGTASSLTWWLPTDPAFDQPERVLGYATSEFAVWQEADPVLASRISLSNTQYRDGPRRRQWDGLEPVEI